MMWNGIQTKFSVTPLMHANNPLAWYVTMYYVVTGSWPEVKSPLERWHSWAVPAKSSWLEVVPAWTFQCASQERGIDRRKREMGLGREFDLLLTLEAPKEPLL